MAVVEALGVFPQSGSHRWLHSRDWDLTFITLSVMLVTLPYLVYLGLVQFEPTLGPAASALHTTVDDLSRNIVNGIVALLVGIPHTFSTFSRTRFDRDYVRTHRTMIRLSIIPPIVVIGLAIASLPLLLTIFFFWASLHTLHQIIYISELYNRRQPSTLTRWSRILDYALILTALYPMAAYRLATHNFVIGLNDISAVVTGMAGSVGIRLGPWLVWLAGSAFGLALAGWLAKSAIEWRRGEFNWPKTLFIGMWAAVAFFVPALANLDSAFQGLNIWHSTQYLALTWMLNNLRQQRGDLEEKPFLKRLSEHGSARRYYLFNMGLAAANIVVAVGVFFILYRINGGFDYALDRAYYIGILSFLWIHYMHDHFLFAEPSLVEFDPVAVPAPA
jgi:hypothetical protein